MAPSDSKISSTAKPWSAEYALTGAFACELIAQQFPMLAPIQIQFLGAGWDNTVFLINNTWVFRFPRRQVAVELLNHEKITFNALHQFPLDYPQPAFYGQRATLNGVHYPWPFIGYKKVAGETACRANIPAKNRIKWVTPLAQALKHLHAQIVPSQLPGDLLKRSDLSYRLPWFQEQWDQAKAAAQQQQQKLPEKAVRTLLQKLKTLSHHKKSHLEPKHLLHGDLYIRHLMVNSVGELTGLIDWGDTHWGDISTDLGIAYSSLPPELHTQFWRVYGEVSQEVQLKAQFRALYSCLYIYRYGIDIQDKHLIREGWQGIQWIASLSP